MSQEEDTSFATVPSLTSDQVKDLIRQEIAGKQPVVLPVVDSKAVRLDSKGLQKQADILLDVDSHLATIQSAFSVEEGTIDGDKIEREAIGARRIIKDRLKLLRIADTGGWTAVQKYKGAASLGDDVADAKRIQKAIDQAKAEKIATQRRFWQARNFRSQPYPNPDDSLSRFGQTAMATRVYQFRGDRYRTPGVFANKLENEAGSLAWNQCRRCMQFGHWSKIVRSSKKLRPHQELTTFSSGLSKGGYKTLVKAIGNEETKIKGSLKKSYEAWLTIDASRFVRDMVENGFTLPFVETPGAAIFKNNLSALGHKDFVEKTIVDLESNGFIRHVDDKPRDVSPLSVQMFSNKLRFILDLRYVNSHLIPPKFRLDDLRIALGYVEKGGYMCSFDIKRGYYHLDVNIKFQQYLGFAWKFNGELKYFVFTVLPFGLSLGPFLFTKLLRPAVKSWRAKGFKTLIYIDDGFLTHSSAEVLSHQVAVVNQELRALGFHFNEKCIWKPVQCLKYLGFCNDTKNFTLSVPQVKVDKARNLVLQLKCKKLSSAREVAKIAGQIISMSCVTGSAARLMTRNCYRFMAEASSWDKKRILPFSVKTELNFWEEYLGKRPVVKLLNYGIPVILGYTDASNSAGAAILVKKGEKSVATVGWNLDQKGKSSTYRELLAVKFGMNYFHKFLKGNTVKFFTDNQAVVSIVRNGSKKYELQAIAKEIFEMCVMYEIRLEIEWIPRDQNSLADYFSKNPDWDDWQIREGVFKWLSLRWGPFTVDRFANHKNNKLPRFNSKIWYPGTEVVDAFSVSWKNEINWLVPPIPEITRCIQHWCCQTPKGH